MLSNLFRRFGVAGPIALLAVVAVAVVASVPAVADPVATSSAKAVKMIKRAIGLSKKANKRSVIANRKATRALKQGGQTGPQGPAGPAGPRGLRGLKGEPGTNGNNGANGTNGVSVEKTADLAPGEGGCAEGGVEYTSATGTDVVCNGEEGDQGEQGVQGEQGIQGEQGPEGQPWDPENTLPDGATLTGMWTLGEQSPVWSVPHPVPTLPPVDIFVTSISFAIPLAEALTNGGGDTNAHYVTYAQHSGGGTLPADCDDGNAANGEPSHLNPEAAAGELCVFAGDPADGIETGSLTVAGFDLLGQGGTSKTGAFVGIQAIDGFYAGSWAVTGFEPVVE